MSISSRYRKAGGGTMNLELLESFGQNYPEEFDGSLDCISMAVTCSFNRCRTEILATCC